MPDAERSGIMYGLIGKMTAQPGQRDALVAAILEGSAGLPGCRSYVVALDAADANAVWITEVWDDEAAHKASLAIPEVRAVIARAMPLIADFGPSFVTTPVGGTAIG
jgi:quinol monooxygenase YgiN